MAIEIASRTPTLADLTAAIMGGSLPSRQRADLVSAVRTTARLLNTPAEHIPADPRGLAVRLAKLTPQTAGVSPGRLANVRSLLRQALSIHKPVLPGRLIAPLSPEWAALYAKLPSRAHQVRLSRLLRWLSSEGLGPQVVTQAELQRFEVTLHENALMTKSADAWRDTVWAWNSARKTILGWPIVEACAPIRQVTYTLPWESFPPSLKADADRYLDRLEGKDPLEPLPFRPVRSSTRATRERQIRSFASALTHQGVLARDIQSLSDLVRIENLKAGLRFFLERRADRKSSTMIAQLAGFLKAIAKHWAKLPPQALKEIDALVCRAAIREHGLTPKNRSRLLVFDDAQHVHALLNLPQTLLRIARSSRYSEWRSAILAQTAVAVELLLMRPIRIDNLRTLDLDQNFVQPSRRSGAVHIVIPADQVKNSVAVEHRLPAESVSLLREYLDKYRPALCGPQNRKLFPAERGSQGCKSIGAFRTQIVRAALRYAGLQINPHLFRHIAAKLHLDRNPGEYGVISELLGHKSLATTKRCYTGLETDAAVRHFDKTILNLRQQAGTRGADGRHTQLERRGRQLRAT